MTSFFSDSPDYLDLVRVVATERELSPSIIEKDYYLTRVLRALASEIGEQFVFKGGTSLSKGWNLIHRFSEDIDLLFRSEQGESTLAKGELYRRMKMAEKISASVPSITVEKSLSDKGIPTRRVKLNFPCVNKPGTSVVSSIILEMGARGGAWPSERRSIRSFLAEYLDTHGMAYPTEDLKPFTIECLDKKRTFVEKLFAIHSSYMEDGRDFKARHYYDLYMLAGLDEIREFYDSEEYRMVCEDIVRDSKEFFPSKQLPDDLSFRSSPAIYPDDDGMRRLTLRYKSIREYFFFEPPSMAEIIERLQSICC